MSISLMLSNLFSLIMPINEMTLVNELLRNETITANYKIAIMIPGQLSFVTQSIIIYYFTIIAKASDGKEVWNISKKVGMMTAGVIGIITVAGAVLSPYIIRIVYGSRYDCFLDSICVECRNQNGSNEFSAGNRSCKIQCNNGSNFLWITFNHYLFCNQSIWNLGSWNCNRICICSIRSGILGILSEKVFI